MNRIYLIIVIAIISFNSFAQSPADGWSIIYPQDEFANDALLDLNYLNESEAGSSGFIRLSDNGETFVDGSGNEIRFWAIGGGDDTRTWTQQQLTHFSKFLAKKGVNMIRTHAKIHSTSSDINAVNKAEVNAIWRLVATMKEQGIYTTISPFWVGHMSNIPQAWGLGEYKGEDRPWGLMYFDPKFQDAYKKWVEYLFTEVNPLTGLALKDDPAVGLIQMKNEDGVFWWSIQDAKPYLRNLMEKQFHDWLVNKYGSISQTYSAWDNLPALDTDNLSAGKMGIYIIWEATQNQTGGKNKRVNDQVQFFAETQRNFYQDIYDHLRNLGCKQLINTTNWKTADPLRLFDAERWTNDVAEVIAVNRYYDPGHVGEHSGWRIDPGHHYVGASVLHNPHQFPINVKQVEGKPFIMSESAWNLPHKYQAEGPFLIAAYSSLTGFDAYYWFTPSSPGIDPNPYHTWETLSGGQHPLFRWTVSTPGQVSMFPANALMYRKGYIKKAPVLVHEDRTLTSIMSREIPIISEENSFDPNRDSYDNAGGGGTTKVAPIAYLAGRVTVKYGTESHSESISPQLSQLLDFQNKKIKSATEELVWDYKQGMAILDAPAAQGICGFPGDKSTYELSSAIIETTNDYVVVNVVSMDEKPIAESEKILIQIGTVYQPTGWMEKKTSFQLNANKTVEGFEIQNTGKMPWKAAKTKVTVTLINSHIGSARVLDMNGYELKEIRVEKINNEQIKLYIPDNAMYIVADTRESTVTEIPSNQKSGITIYPNPNNGQFSIHVENITIKYDEVEIRDLSGRLVKYFSKPSSVYEVALPQGLYMVNLKYKGTIVSRSKIVLNRVI
jgi:hypothetical protein